MNSDEIDVKFEHIMFSANKIINLKTSLKSAKSDSEKQGINNLISEYTKYIEANTTEPIEYTIRHTEQINDLKVGIKEEGNPNKKHHLRTSLKIIEDHVKSHIASAEQRKSQSDKASQFRNSQKDNLELFAMLNERQAEVIAEIRAEAREKKLQKYDTKVTDISDRNKHNRADGGR